MEPIHDRMPVILEEEHWKLWLDPKVDEKEALIPLLDPYDPGLMDAYEVSTYANSPAHEDPGVIAPVGIAALF